MYNFFFKQREREREERRREKQEEKKTFFYSLSLPPPLSLSLPLFLFFLESPNRIPGAAASSAAMTADVERRPTSLGVEEYEDLCFLSPPSSSAGFFLLAPSPPPAPPIASLPLRLATHSPPKYTSSVGRAEAG